MTVQRADDPKCRRLRCDRGSLTDVGLNFFFSSSLVSYPACVQRPDKNKTKITNTIPPTLGKSWRVNTLQYIMMTVNNLVIAAVVEVMIGLSSRLITHTTRIVNILVFVVKVGVIIIIAVEVTIYPSSLL